MIKLAVVTAVASLLFFAGCSGASPSGDVPDSTEAAPAASAGPGTPSDTLASGTASGAAADQGASIPSSSPPGAAAAVPAPVAPIAGCQMEAEPNDTRVKAQVLTLIGGADGIACGALGKAGDEDWFVVHVTGADADLTVAMTTSDAVTVELFAPGGATYQASHGAGAAGRAAGAIDAWDGPGDYAIHVTSATNALVSYSLALGVAQ
jgi:hypothetical protein